MAIHLHHPYELHQGAEEKEGEQVPHCFSVRRGRVQGQFVRGRGGAQPQPEHPQRLGVFRLDIGLACWGRGGE